MKKRLLSLALTLAMVLALLPATALAAEENLDSSVDIEWYSNEENEFILSTAAELAGLAKLVNEGTDFSKKTILLGKDIDLEEREWTPIGSKDNPFKGNFDGQKHTISNLVINKPSESNVGLFGYTANGKVSNFCLENAKVTGYVAVGAVAGTPFTSEYSDIVVTGLIQVKGFADVGGAFGKDVYGDLINVDVSGEKGSIVTANSVDTVEGMAYRTYLGGLVGYMGEGSTKISECNVEIDVSGSTCDIGGILGILHYGNTMEKCTYKGCLTLTAPGEPEDSQFGALTGTVMNSTQPATITDCTATVFKAMRGSQDVTDTITAHGDFYYGLGSSNNETGKVSVSATVNENPVTVDNNVAKIRDTGYRSLAAAVNAAKESLDKTVELLADVEIDKWTQIWNLSGITFKGNNHIIKINAIESLENHDAVFHSSGNNTFQDLTINLSGIESASQAQGNRAFSAAPGDKFYNVKVIGNEYVNYGITVGGTVPGENEEIIIKDCAFTNCEHGVYSDKDTNLEKLSITDSTFTNCDYASILYTKNVTFTGNTVSNGKLNIMHNTQTVTGNTFKDASRIKFYAAPSSFEKNSISSDSYLDAKTCVDEIDVAKNYWGGNAPTDKQLGNAGDCVIGQDVYYTRPTMKDEDLNTYDPPTTDSGSSDPIYSISTPDKVIGGSVKVTPNRASAGTRVTITVKPDSGYELDELIVTDRKGDELKVTDRGDNKYTFQMTNSKVEIEVSFTKIEEKPTGNPFIDVAEGSWYADAVQYVYDKGLMAGTSSTTFSPDATTTRGMIVTILYRLEGTPAVSGASGFTDVADGQYYADAVAWAAVNNIVGGYGNGLFGPNDTITREQMAAILYRYAQYKGYDVTASADLSGYSDVAQVSSYALAALQWANAEGLVNGTSDTTLTPGGSATRAQVAVILMRFCENIK